MSAVSSRLLLALALMSATAAVPQHALVVKDPGVSRVYYQEIAEAALDRLRGYQKAARRWSVEAPCWRRLCGAGAPRPATREGVP
jgi:hypothetical protein